jgi:hypothetical protein
MVMKKGKEKESADERGRKEKVTADEFWPRLHFSHEACFSQARLLSTILSFC